MDVGVVLQTTPPAARASILRGAPRRTGSAHVWTFDSHILWEEPYVIHSKILDETRNVVVGPMVTNPGHPRLDGHGVDLRHAQRDVRQPHRLRLGRGARRLGCTNGKPTTLATMRESIHVIRELANGRSVDSTVRRSRCRGQRRADSTCAAPVTAPRRWQLIGETCDGFILQLADLPIAEWTIDAARTAASDAGRNPDDISVCVAARPTSGRQKTSPTCATSVVGSVAWSAITSPTSSSAMATPRGAGGARPTTSRVARRTTTTSTARRQQRTRRSFPTRSSIASASSAPSRRSSTGCHALADLGVDQFAVISSTTARTTRSLSTAST